MFKRFIVFSIFFFTVSSAIAAEKDVISMMSVKQRLERVERMVGSEMLMQQSQQIEALQEEIAVLREQLDQQGYELSTIKQRQRSLYADMDRRINVVETSAPALGISAPVPAPGSNRAPVSTPGNHATMIPASPSSDANGKSDYDKAFALLKEGRYKQAIVAFGSFLESHSNSQYADNAQYWLGEANYAYRQYKQALSEFQRLIEKYPDSSKVQGARLKIAYVYYEMKNWTAARESLQQIIKLFPNTNLAKKANERLERITREGH
ncbi:MAG: tol-pal system protein YbgF [Gammaproteobacteria bacterium]|nr:tol-pal system protein YbgF [Gammaproteobacteria bacterium]